MNMDFGKALEALKAGHRVARRGWNGKGMWLLLIDGDAWAFSDWVYGDDRGGHVSPLKPLPWIGMRTADGGFVPWLASQTDILANDWQVVEG